MSIIDQLVMDIATEIHDECLNTGDNETPSWDQIYTPISEVMVAITRQYPMQPIELDINQTARFERNPIVRYLIDEGSIDLNQIAIWTQQNSWKVPQKYQEQFAQLLGYSVSGYGDLSFVSDESYERAQSQVEKLLEYAGPAQDAPKSLIDILKDNPVRFASINTCSATPLVASGDDVPPMVITGMSQSETTGEHFLHLERAYGMEQASRVFGRVISLEDFLKSYDTIELESTHHE